MGCEKRPGRPVNARPHSCRCARFEGGQRLVLRPAGIRRCLAGGFRPSRTAGRGELPPRTVRDAVSETGRLLPSGGKKFIVGRRQALRRAPVASPGATPPQNSPTLNGCHPLSPRAVISSLATAAAKSLRKDMYFFADHWPSCSCPAFSPPRNHRMTTQQSIAQAEPTIHPARTSVGQ